MSFGREYTRLPSGLLAPLPTPVLLPSNSDYGDLKALGLPREYIPQDEYSFIEDSLQRWHDRAFKP